MSHSSVFTQPDFKKNPLRAVLKRILWRTHWNLHPNKPVRVHQWWRGMDIQLLNSASAAPIYYRNFSSTAKLETFIDLVKPGMTAIDIGAHVGEYTLVLSELVGERGYVHAFEPQPELADLIRLNAALNGRQNVKVHQCAVGKGAGEIGFIFDERSRGGWTAPEGAQPSLTVKQRSIDEFVATSDVPRIDLIKIDAAGSEFEVLQGATRCIREMRPIVVGQVYNPETVQERQGNAGEMIIKALQELHYEISVFDEMLSKERTSIDSYPDLLARFRATEPYALSLIALPKE